MTAAVASSYSEAANFLESLLQDVPDQQCLEFRTFKKGRPAKKTFYRLDRLRQQGFRAALPCHLDGKTNIYYGIAPRYEPREAQSDSDRGDAVNLAVSLWLDEITVPAPDLPPFSWMVETSVGKAQAGYLLKAPASDLDRVELLNQRLGAAVGGDKVWNRGRVLRLPGFINLNHPGSQRAQLLEFNPELRYSLDELDRQLPKLPDENTAGPRSTAGKHRQSGTFDPHWPCPLPPLLQDRLTEFFDGLGLRRHFDGRFRGACPFPHQGGVRCDCDSAFYVSPISGSWSCFCSDHLGATSGTVRSLASVGFVANLTLSEIQAEIGKYHVGPGEIIHRKGTKSQVEGTPHMRPVADTVKAFRASYRRSDRSKDRGKRPRLWAEAQELFAFPNHIKPWRRGYMFWSERDNKGLAVDLLSNSWRNPANAQFKRQKLYFNILPRVNGPQLYQWRVPIDDWDDKVHGRISRAIQRRMTGKQGWLWINNAVDRGYILYLTDVAGITGFEPVTEDVRPILIDALKAIHPPARNEDEKRFRPYGGSQNWVGRAETTGEEDAGRWEMVAVAQGRTDFVAVEAECVVSGVKTENTPPFWRGQPYHGLAMRHGSKESFVEFAQIFGGKYSLTKAALAEICPEVK